MMDRLVLSPQFCVSCASCVFCKWPNSGYLNLFIRASNSPSATWETIPIEIKCLSHSSFKMQYKLFLLGNQT